MAKYHPATGIPAAVQAQLLTLCVGIKELRWTRHAWLQAKQDKFDIFEWFSTMSGTVFEVKTDDGGAVVELGYRVPGKMRRGWDVCIVVKVTGQHWTVITCWANKSWDTHKTLRKEEYAR